MSALEPTGPNAEQITYWNETAGPRWVALQEQLDAQLGPLGEATMAHAGLAPGDRVLDVGCGCGATSIELARRVGTTGAVLGVDLSAGMLEVARARAEHAGLRNASFLQSDAQTSTFERGRFDVLFSRFGVMFFADPPAAFANLRAALRPGGRAALLCWQGIEKNPWLAVPLAVARQHVEILPPASPDAPGPFALADPDRLRGVLSAGGLSRVALEPLELRLTVGGGRDLDAATDFLLQMGPTGVVLRGASDGVRARVSQAVKSALAPHATKEGVVMDSAAWIATGVNP
jgi:SAM-dependent methyltransferase